MRMMFVAMFLAAGSVFAAGQIRITSIETVPLPAGRFWMAPGWAPDGKAFYVSTTHYRGLWRYDLQAGTLAEITNDAGAGFGWSASPDGATIAYRKTIEGPRLGDRSQEIVRVDLATGTSVSMTAAGSVDNPVFSGDALVVNDARAGYAALGTASPDAGAVAVLGIENTKIALLRNGQKTLLDPFGDGSYIWPSLSPDGRRLLAYDMARGAFVCDLLGNVIARLGRLDAPAWTHNGSWIIFMREENDGHVITGSDLYATSPDGQSKVRLTATQATELAPSCSPVDNRILCSTAEGAVLVLTYEEVGR